MSERKYLEQRLTLALQLGLINWFTFFELWLKLDER